MVTSDLKVHPRRRRGSQPGGKRAGRLAWLGCVVALAGCSGGGTEAGGGGGTKKGGGSDNDPPIISAIVVDASRTTALVKWTTDELATSAVAYGKTSSYEVGTVTDASMTKEHQILLERLEPDTTYYFQVTSVDASNNAATKGDLSFKTAVNADNTPPKISFVTAYTVHDMALVQWDTDELANARVDYGLTTSYGQVAQTGLFRRVQQILIVGLQPDTIYDFKVTSADPHKNVASADGFYFKTKAAPDTTPPSITNISVVATKDSATVTWTTNEPANSRVDYGTSSSYGSTQTSGSFVTSHSLTLTRLTPDTTYHFKVTSSDASGNKGESEDRTFKTKGAPDTTPPKISNIGVVVSYDSATITWRTDEPASSRVDYGRTNKYGQNQGSATRVTSHQVRLTGLASSAAYHFKVTSVDAAGNSSSSGDDTFITKDRPKAGTKDVISQFGITWTFDKAYPAGQFANGDWWVVGPVKVVKINPPSRSGTRIKNGSMINPVGGIGSPNKVPLQGYDNRTKHVGYNPALNVALNVSTSKPLVVQPHSSLVSTISFDQEWRRPQLKSAAILTVLPKAASAGDFRPSYCGKNKTIKFNVSQLKYSRLKTLKPVGKPPSLATVERMFERPWLEHAPHWMGSFMHPEDNMKMYGRDLCTEVGTGSLMLNLDIPLDQKKTLLIRFVQLGIDKQGIADNGGHRNWVEAGGHNQGRKWPILFAGLLLDDAHMKNIGKQDVWFQEDRQCFYITQADINRTGHPQADLGKPMWSEEHAWRPHRDTLWGKNNYQFCCTANSMNGTLLSAMAMGAKKLWNHDATFDYQDRYLRKGKTLAAWLQSYDPWSLEMWKAYRSKY